MPEMTFTVRWPNGSIDACYSPSLVVHDHLEVGVTYSVAEFADRSTAALDEASDRVRARFGFACTSAQATKERILARAVSFAPDQCVLVLALEPPLPSPTAPPQGVTS